MSKFQEFRKKMGKPELRPRGKGDSPDKSSLATKNLLNNARKTGQLNLSCRNLARVPDEVWTINTDVPDEFKDLAFSSGTNERWWDQESLTKLNLSFNQIDEISENIRCLSALTVLDLHDNKLKNLPSSMAELENMKKLNLSHNEFEKVPSCVYKCKQLVFLHLENNKLTEIHDDISDLFYLEDLDLSHNRLKALSESVSFLSRVVTLNVSNNELKELPLGIASMRALRMLDATHNKLTEVPNEIGFLHELEQLYLRHNQLQTMPTLEGTALKELHLGNNCIKELLPRQLEQLLTLTVLDLRDNKISTLPEEITLLTSLERLDLTNNDLSSIPYEVGTMKLHSLLIEGNSLRSIRQDIRKRGTYGLLKYLRSRIEGDKSTEDDIGSTLYSDKQVEERKQKHLLNTTRCFDYSNKNATEVPEELWKVALESRASSVNLVKNQLNNVPKQITLLSDTLNDVYLGFNKLTSVSPDLSYCTNIVVLDLRNNQLSSLPSELQSLVGLRDLVISFNRFTDIPPFIYNLANMENFLAADNKISKIDAEGFSKLRKLAVLDLQNNDISVIPPELGNLTSLRSLQIDGNCFRVPRPAIIAKGTAAVLEYLRGRIVT